MRAEPESQGAGKYQLSAGAKPAFALPPGSASIGSPKQSASVQLQQVVSFAGDPARTDINQTKFEFEWRDTWPSGNHAKATLKPVIDWVGDGQTGAVLEFEYGWLLERRWSLALMAGGRLWGEGVPGTYLTRAELKLTYRYQEALRGMKLDGHIAAEILKPFEQAADGLGAVLAVKVVGTEVGVFDPVAQHVEGNRQHRCGHRQDGLLRAAASLAAAGTPCRFARLDVVWREGAALISSVPAFDAQWPRATQRVTTTAPQGASSVLRAM